MGGGGCLAESSSVLTSSPFPGSPDSPPSPRPHPIPVPVLRSCQHWPLPPFLPATSTLSLTYSASLPPHRCSVPQMRALFLARSGALLPPTGEGTLAFTSFSRKVALESEKDIDRAGGLSPSPGPGAPRQEQDRAAALHTGSHLHAWPRPTTARLRRLLPSLSPGSLPLSSSLLPSLPSLFLSLRLCHSLPPLSPFSPALSISVSSSSLRSMFSSSGCLLLSFHPYISPPFSDPPSPIFFLKPLPRKDRDSGAPTATGRRAAVAGGLPGLRGFRPLLCAPGAHPPAPEEERRRGPSDGFDLSSAEERIEKEECLCTAR